MSGKNNKAYQLFVILAVALMLQSCREDEVVVPTEYDLIPDHAISGQGVQGMYLLNEGNMGSNKCTLDYVDFVQGYYVRNLYAERNPTVIKELGDVGNDIQVYGSRLYVVVNSSNKIEVLDARSARRIGQVDIPNVRYIRFHKGYAYASSYVGPVQLTNPDAVSISSDAPVEVSLGGIATDADNMDVAIVKTVKAVSDESVLKAEIRHGDLVVTPLSEGNATVTIGINSNGKLAEASVDITVVGGTGIEMAGEGVQPQLHYSVDGKRVDASQRGLHVVRMQNGHTRKIVVR